MRTLLFLACLIVFLVTLPAGNAWPEEVILAISGAYKGLVAAGVSKDLFAAGAAILGGAWVLFAFEHSRRVKTGELLAGLENGVNTSLSTLLRIENGQHYAKHFALPLLKSLALTDAGVSTKSLHCVFNSTEDAELKNLEAALRHLHICWHVRGAGSHARAIDDAYRYYLQLVVSDARPELRDYVLRFWPNIYQWGKRLEVGVVRGFWIAVDFELLRISRWLSGSPILLAMIPYGSTPVYFRRLYGIRRRMLARGETYRREMESLRRVKLTLAFVLSLFVVALFVNLLSWMWQPDRPL